MPNPEFGIQNSIPGIKIYIIAAIICMAVFFPTAIFAADPVEEYSFNVGDFTSIRIQDNVNAVYHCSTDSTAVVTYRSDPDFENAFIFTNHDGNLKIQVTTEDVSKPGLPTIHIYSKRLDKAENYSDFHLEIIDPAPTSHFTASLIGNGSITARGVNATSINARITAGMGNINIAGKCDNAEYRMTGTGTINASDMKAGSVVCKILGGGTIYCAPVKLLKIRGIGSTRIIYSGNPAIKRSGGGKIIKASSSPSD